MTEYGVNVGRLAFIAALCAVLAVAVIVGLQAGFFWYQRQYEAAGKYDQPDAKLEQRRIAQQELLTGYRSLDEEKGVVQLPIGRAIDLVLIDLTGPAEMPNKNKKHKGESP
ncbi:MAG: hypothetical protein JW818_11235 [Pirellulales bacterium]|nr:hypothetical protein [Pirellulales bacterium]